jgi:indole-3-glycerol phosphate synthase
MTLDDPTSVLATIVAATRRRVAAARDVTPLGALEARVAQAGPGGSRQRAVETLRAGGVRVIAECKRRSPSRGVLRADYDPARIAAAYEAAGAAAISVLTEPAFFDGDLEHLRAVRARVSLPVLRKDFTVDRYQIAEARLAGADMVLLIVAALDDTTLADLLAYTRDLDLAALVEVHDDEEARRAVDAGAEIIGVNNRNLKTLAVSIETSYRIADQLPATCVRVAESGLRTGDDLVSLRAAGYDAFLIGERFMTDDDPGAALARVLAGAAAGPGAATAEATP